MANVCSHTMLPEHVAFPEITRGPSVFAGDEACLTIGLLAGLRAARPGRPLLIVDGANAFDPFLVADLARKSGLPPHALLDQIRISRVFTCHQLEALLSGRLQAAVQQFRAPAVYFSGLLDPLLSEEAPAGEAVRIFRLVIPALRRLVGTGVVTLVACPPPHDSPGREQFFPLLCKAAAWVFRVTRTTRAHTDGSENPAGHPERKRGIPLDVVQITCTKPQAATWTWEPHIGMIAARRWW